MGVSDNKSYKDMYHFKDNFPVTREGMPSVNVDPKINSTIKKNPYRSNVEVEKDEIILKPDLSALFNVKGKTHKGGGVDVLLEPDSFIFSNDKSLAFTKSNHKMMEFKEGGNFKPAKNTPAEVLKRNIELKHYNRMIANIEDPMKDDITKNSSTKMLEKYMQTLGNIAFLQEQKKGFPDGVPPFAENTAPVYDDELKEEVMQQKQYAKFGGNVRAQLGKILNPTNSIKSDPYPDIEAPFQFNNKWYVRKNGKMVEVSGPATKASSDNYFLNPANPYGNPNAQFPPTIDYTGRPAGYPGNIKGNVTAPAVSTPTGNATPGMSGVARISGVKPEVEKIEYIPHTPDKIIPRVKGDEITPDTLPQVANLNLNGDGVKRADWQFTPWQKENQAYNLWKWASAKRYMPYRSHLNPSYVDPTLVNPEQAIGDMKGAYNANLQGINSLSPILRNAQASESYGQLLNQIPGVRSQYDNQNAGITNQFRQYNNQIANQARQTNMVNDQNYYKETVVGQQNFDNLRSYLGDKYMTDRSTDVADNQSLAYQLLTQNNPAWDYDWRTGNFTRTKKDIRDAQTSPQSDLLSNLLGDLIPKFTTLDPRVQAALLKTAGLKNLPLNYQKKGGTFNPYKK